MVGEVFIYWSKSHVSGGPRGPLGGPRGHLGGPRGRQGVPHPLPVSPPQNFKREEQNFVVQNEINNMSFLTADSKSKMAKVGWGTPKCTPKPPQEP